MSARSNPVGFVRSFARVGIAAAAALAVSLAAAAPAEADTGQIGSYTGATCGWYPYTESLLSLWDDKIVRVNLPSVTGVTTDQRIWAHVDFQQAGADGTLTTYRSGWFSTFASPGQPTNSWTSYAGGTSGATYFAAGTTGFTYLEDAPGESGYAAGDVANLSTSVEVTLYWMTGSTVTGTAAEYAQNPASSYRPDICNTGGTLF